MASEIEPLHSSFPHEFSGQSSHRLPFGLRVLLWSMGIAEWNYPSDGAGDHTDHDESKKHCREPSSYKRRLACIFSVLFVNLVALSSVTAFGFYMFWYFGKVDHFLRFISFTCYWPSVMSVQIICIAHLLMKLIIPRHNGIVTWLNLFDEASCIKKFASLRASKIIPLPKLGTFVFVFAFFPTLYTSLQMLAYLYFSKNCQYSLEYLWVIVRALNSMFFGGFCYFLYLHRVCVEKKGDESANIILENEGDLKSCIAETRAFFKVYFELRRLIIPWLSLILFSSTFGFTCFVKFSYEILKFNGTTDGVGKNWLIPSAAAHDTANGATHFCVYVCDNKQDQIAYYSIVVVIRLLLISVLPIVVVMGMDLKYIWNRFRMKFNFMYPANERKFWKHLTTYMDKLHPCNSADLILGFFFSLMGFASGLISGKHY